MSREQGERRNRFVEKFTKRRRRISAFGDEKNPAK